LVCRDNVVKAFIENIKALDLHLHQFHNTLAISRYNLNLEVMDYEV